MSPSLLSVEDCRVSYGAVTALNGVSLQLAPGEAVGIVGPLSAGKTTLLNTISGLVAPQRGVLRYRDRDLRGVPADARARQGIVHVPADGGFFATLTVAENLALAGPARRSRDAFTPVTQLFPVLGERLEQRAGSLSGGEQRQLAIARGALAEPSLLLLDEPLLGLSPKTVHRVLALLSALREQSVAMLVVEERPTEDLTRLVDRVVGIRNGRIVPAEDVAGTRVAVGAAAGSLDRVDVETIGIPLSTRDRRALQTIAQAAGEPVGAVVAHIIHEHVESSKEVWQ
jgi:branched-chain amino acid transport system ATP-binding protein